MKTVNFTRMEDGTREEYEFLDQMEDEYKAGLPERILDSLRKLEHSLSGYRINRLEHSLQGATRAFRAYWVIKHHGVFQMYYYAHHCGGDRNAREMFKDNPWYQDAIDFCHNYDQNCFDPDYDSEPLEFFEPILRRVLSQPSVNDPEQVARYGKAS
jgi:predicted HD phosphohydrolase